MFLAGALAIMQMVAIWLILGFEKPQQVVSEPQGRNIRDKGKQSMSIADVQPQYVVVADNGYAARCSAFFLFKGNLLGLVRPLRPDGTTSASPNA